MERSTIVRVHEGLHARPATRFVKLAKGFESDVELVKDGKAVSAKSSVKLMLLAVKENQEVTVRANGADAIEALEALIGYLENPRAGLDDEAEAQSPANDAGQEAAPAPGFVPAAPDGANRLRGVAASEGFAIGPAFAHFPPDIAGRGRVLRAEEIEGEIDRFRTAVGAVQARMDLALAQDSLSAGDRGIVAALRDIAADDSLTGEAEGLIKGGNDAVSAVITAASTIAAEFSAVDDHYLNARTDDVHAVGRQICLVLLGQDDISLENIPEGAILIADDIGAWDLARAPLKRIGGVVCGHGGATSHIAIIARSHGIPAVLGLGGQINALRTAREVALDGNAGHVIIDPDAATRADFAGRVEAAAKERAGLTIFKTVTPKLADGRIIEIAANIGSLEEIEAAQEAGAMGIGLFRTELLFMRHMHLPSEDMQAETYAALAKAFAPYPVIVRTLDIGGDKPIAGIEFPDEENPFLGWRGIRMCLDRPDIFKRQLRALLRAAVHGNIKVMLPMVSDLSEVRQTRVLVDECTAELKAEGVPHASFDLGVMIETPAAVLIAPALAKEVAFFSIGTNDLTQYIMAADRLNPTVAKLNDVTNPAVMSAIEMTAKAGVAAGIMVGMCGEAAGRPDLIATFVKMGLTELSMSPASIQRAKKAIMAMAAEG
ncbi:phosphoenolpyruvate--protein phosphotransferase [Mesorhizobium sp. M7A.F.Ca.CA.001.07.2.1]|uniref:phosphoenolpyruvate--protein phosphotransferase n=4 Tax=Phyllobacteriaceae TaxID=69277 RepID=UPI000FCB5E50|nr:MULTISPECIES: phosphoenolpyruvate--protein phosphotransferase [Mesorhizobium]RVB45843.1 phosphoenolpyruvate--protein phosphotransferase [Mesorhizobium sp. M7A.F.Ca.CA.004.05.1.1]MCF6127133.1 phosphoenolpyruvate--protein phosphotransferase [Mesorhizobium ciceri]MCQ8818177.1 phosphoenolpyruvate--protein phosphotransferase [Mesorhizobium sp. SEMIA396]RUX71072.1 phosphoenolpyruvate--protein phosphotransferase [Mesorhizobium sp. M7A.F.Ca.CA.004.08.2.1]RUX84600.1 phosphoenolpyruvate--protein phos